MGTIVAVSAQIVFLTLYLGLISGRQPVELQVGPDVKSVRILLDGREAAMMKAPPWRAIVDLGTGFEPRGLVAVGYDRDGDEIARASQTLNLPRPLAELTIGLETNDKGTPTGVTLRWEHVYAAKPSRASINVDGVKLRVDEKFHAQLPALDRDHPHLVGAELRFADGVVARRELVIAGGPAGDSVSTELTPVAFSGKPSRPTLDGCLSVNGTAVQTRAVETPDAQVLVVRDPDVSAVLPELDPGRRFGFSFRELQYKRYQLPLDTGTKMSYTWPVAVHLEAAGHIPSNVFMRSAIVPSNEAGMLGFLMLSYGEATGGRWGSAPNKILRFTDAVAVAGLNASGAHRRAVVLVLSKAPDQSTMQPASVRRYLEAIGVPLFVWSLSGPRPDLAQSWGAVDDISSMKLLGDAVDRLRASLASQHIVWVASDPLSALRLEADPRCGITLLAHSGR